MKDEKEETYNDGSAAVCFVMYITVGQAVKALILVNEHFFRLRGYLFCLIRMVHDMFSFHVLHLLDA